MKTTPFLLAAIALSSLLGAPHMALANDAPSTAALVPPTATSSTVAPTATAKKSNTTKIVITATASTDKDTDTNTDSDSDADADAKANEADAKDSHDSAIVSIGHDSHLASGERATAVVSVFGSSTVAGQVDEAVVSVLGNTHVTGPVGEAAVAVFGNTYVDSHVGEAVVAVMGNVELGPHADIAGDVVAIGGDLKRDPAAVVHGSVQNVAVFGHMNGFEWLHPWIRHCLMYARPLAFAPGLSWAWTVALSFLALYLLIALLFPKGVNQCVRTMEAQPGRTVLASLLTFLCKPIVFLLLVVIVIGAILVPFLLFTLFIAGLFGKAVALAWLGRRVIPARDGGQEPLPVLAVLVGGAITLLLYVVPVVGFITYKALDVLGLGIVVYTLLLGFRASRARSPAPRAAPPTASPPPPAASQTEPLMAAQNATAESPDAPATTAAAAPAAAAAQVDASAPAQISIELENRAGFWLRMAALLLDLILVAIAFAAADISGHRVLLALAVYGAVMWKLKGTTIGGVVCGLRVVRLDGRPIDWPTAVARALGCFLSGAVAGLGFIWVVFDSERQSWHDKIAGTVVVRAPRALF